MAQGKGKGPHPLDPKVTKKLLDGLTSDDDFRQRFAADAMGTLESIGYVAPTDDSMHAGSCLQLKGGASLASADQIANDRKKLETSLAAIQDFASSKGFTA